METWRGEVALPLGARIEKHVLVYTTGNTVSDTFKLRIAP